MRFLVISFLCSLFLVFTKAALAAENQFITIVNPVRGEDFFSSGGGKPVDNVKRQWQEIESKNLPATWLIRPDALEDKNIVNTLKSFPQNQELGLFMEVTPSWTKFSGISYRQSASWHMAGSVFLTGYEVSERRKLIDRAFEDFKSKFGFYPKSVGAWWIDAGSLSYMKEKYDILANMDVADQYTTDNYQVWGQYWSSPFYPSQRNALVPGSGEDRQIGVVTIQWATRDPVNAYGNGVIESTYSVQANDYSNKKYHNLNIEYFKKLLAIYLDNPYSKIGQVTVGLENDFSWRDYGGEFSKQMEEVAKRRGTTQIVTMSQFAQNFKSLFKVTPIQIIFAKDPLGSENLVLWFQNLRYRVGWFYGSQGSVIRDLRIFQDSHDEPCFLKRCDSLNMAMLDTQSIDDVTFGRNLMVDEGRISKVNITTQPDSATINYINQSNHTRNLTFLPNDVSIDKNSLPVSDTILRVFDTSKIQPAAQNFNFTLKDGFLKTTFEQIKGLVIFLAFSFLFFYLPGLALLKRSGLETHIKFILSWPLGLVVFTLTGFILSFFKAYLGLIFLPIVSFILVRRDLVLPRIKVSKDFFTTGAIILLGSTSWILTTFKSGLEYDYGLGFWGPNGHDAIWHLSLIESLKNGLPIQNPVFSGTYLFNYHYFYDLLLALSNNLTGLSSIDLYFRFFPILISLLSGLVVFILARRWFNCLLTANMAVFLMYFGGSFGWILSYFQNGSFGGETTFWAQQGISTLLNPPFAISIPILLAGLYFLLDVRKDGINKITVLLIALLWGSLVEFKAYGGVLVLAALGITTVFEIFRKNFNFLKMFLPTMLLSLAIYLPNNLGGNQLFVLTPFWIVHAMIDSPDRVGWVRLTQARISAFESGNWFKFTAAEVIGFIIFILGNLGVRLIGFFGIKKLFTLSTFNIFVASFLSLSLIAPLLLSQKGASFNVVQFFYYFLLLFNFLAAFVLGNILANFKIFKITMVVIFILLTIPTTWNTLQNYLPARPPAKVSSQEIEALDFLRQEPSGVVLSYPYDSRLKDKFLEPKPLLAYETTGYIPALTGKEEYIADAVNLEILGVDYKGRLQAQRDVFSFKEPDIVKKNITSGNIKYLYLLKVYKISVDADRFGLKKVFDNSEVEIYQTDNQTSSPKK